MSIDLSGTASATFWEQYFAEHPNVLYLLLGDLYAITKAHGAPVRRGGRRARSVSGDLDDLLELLTPQFSTKPFPEACRELMGERSLRQVCRTTRLVDHQGLHRFMTGARSIVNVGDPKGSMARLEDIAQALKVHPSYFAEYRRLWIFAVLDEAFTADPNASIGVVKKYAGLTQNGR